MILKLRSIRTARGMSLSDLAARTGIPAPTLSRIERGIYPTYPGWRKRIARALRMPETDLFEPEADADDARREP
jgi:transcriptional regulator with XRE-family HTH domain